MAEARHIRLSRKELREPDEFQTLTAQVATWVQANQIAVAGAVSALLAIGVLVLGVSWYGNRQARVATSRFDSALALFESKTFAEAATEFASLASAFPRTGAGHVAGLYRGHALARIPDPSGAATAYAEYLAGSPSTTYLRQEALLGLGQVQEQGNDTQAALDSYRQASEIDGPFRTPARLALARLEATTGNPDRAKGLYAELSKAPDLDPATRDEIESRLPRTAAPATAPADETR